MQNNRIIGNRLRLGYFRTVLFANGIRVHGHGVIVSAKKKPEARQKYLQPNVKRMNNGKVLLDETSCIFFRDNFCSIRV